MKVQLGKYQNRSNRIVVITSSRMQEVTEADGSKRTVRIWTGTLMKADGRTVDSAHDYEDSGAFRNQRGVTSPMDLSILVEATPVPEPDPVPDEPVPVKPRAADDPRIRPIVAKLAGTAYAQMLREAKKADLPVDDLLTEKGALKADIDPATLEKWIDLVAETLLEILQAFEPTPVTTA